MPGFREHQNLTPFPLQLLFLFPVMDRQYRYVIWYSSQELCRGPSLPQPIGIPVMKPQLFISLKLKVTIANKKWLPVALKQSFSSVQTLFLKVKVQNGVLQFARNIM